LTFHDKYHRNVPDDGNKMRQNIVREWAMKQGPQDGARHQYRAHLWHYAAEFSADVFGHAL
jgi:hypothetical protein